MKKAVLIPLLFLFVALFTVSCEKEMPEHYNLDYQISKIWLRSETGYPDVNFYYEDGFLKKVDLSDSTYYEFYYDANSYNRLSTIVHYNRDYIDYPYMETIRLTYERYDDNENAYSYVFKMEYEIEGTIKKVVSFTRRDDRTISSIREVYDSTFYNHLEWIFDKSDFYKMFMGDDLIIRNHLKNKDSKSVPLTLEAISMPIYDATGENIIKIYKNIPDLNLSITTDITYSYDSYNPFYNLPFGFVNLLGYSKHARVLEASVISDIEEETTTISQKSFYYTFNDAGFPERIITRDTDYNDMPWNMYILYKE